MHDWFCPWCGGRLSYGIYCKTCEQETLFAYQPVEPEISELVRLLASLSAPPYPEVSDELG